MRYHGPVLLLVAAIAGGIFVNAVGGDFVWDDYYIIYKNPQIRDLREGVTCFGLRYWLRLRAEGWVMGWRAYRPVPELTFAVDYSIWELNPTGYHITSILVHVANSILVYFVAHGILGNRRGAAFCAVLFAAHPIHVEAVVWAKARSEPLALLFTLAAWLLYWRCGGRPGSARGAALYGGSVAAFGLALTCKESAVVLPVLLALYVWYFVPRRRLMGRLVGLLPFVGVAAAFFAIGAVLPSHFHPGLSATLWQRCLTALATVGAYLRLVVAPVGLCLNHDFSIVRWPHHRLVLQALPWELALAVGMVVAYRRSRVAFFALAWLLIGLGPVSNLKLLGRPIAEPRLYAPSVGFCLLAALLLQSIPAVRSARFGRRTLEKLSLVLCGFVVILYSGLSMARNLDWVDPLRLFYDTARKNPRGSAAYHSLGLSYLRQDRVDLALPCFKRAVAVRPDYLDALEGLATIYYDIGRFEEAIPYYRRMLYLRPIDAYSHERLGIAYAQTGDLGRAITQFRRALDLDPQRAESHYNTGLAWIKLGDCARAAPALREAVKLAPDDPQAHYGLALVYDRMGQYKRALPEYEEAVRLRPRSGGMWLGTAGCYERLGKRADAIRRYRKCLTLGGEAAAAARQRLAELGALSPGGS